MRSPKLLSRVVALLLACMSGASCASYPPGTPLPDILAEVNATLRPDVIVMQPGDGLNLRFPNNSQWDQTTTIRPDGKARFLLIGEMEVGGLTIPEVQDLLSNAYEQQILSPDLVVRPTGLTNRNVFFMGSVGGQASLPIAPGRKLDLIEAFARTGTPKDTFTLLEHLVLIRWFPEEQRRRYWVIDAREEHWTHPELLYLQANDIVYLPRHPVKPAAEWVREAVKLIPIPYLNLVN